MTLLVNGKVLPQTRLLAIALMIAANGCFSVLDATAKYLSTTAGLPVEVVIWQRFLWHMLFGFLLFRGISFGSLVRTSKPFMQAVRSLLLLGATIGNFVAIKYLQLDQTITIFFLSPLLVAALAGPLLGEWIGWRRLTAIMSGFFGVILITRPGFGGIHWAVLFSFGAVLSYSLYNIATRYLAAHDSSEVTQFFSPLAGLAIMAPLAFYTWQWPSDLTSWLLLASLGVSGGAGHWFLILAHRHAPAPILAPFVYVGLIFMTILGYLIFGDIPTLWTLSGGAVVIGSGLYLLYRERVRSGA